MKKIVLFSFFLFATIFSFSQSAQISNHVATLNNFQDSISVTISPGTSDANTITSLETILKNMLGVRYIGYCSKHNIFLLTVSSSSFTTQQLFYNYIKSTSNVSTLLLKEGKQSDILPFCFESKNVERTVNPAIEKALLDH